MSHEKPTERFVNGALGFTAIVLLIVVPLAGKLPSLVAWLIETPVFIGGFAGMAVYKRNRWGWLWTGYVALVCVMNLVLSFMPGTARLTGLFWVAGGLIAAGWLCMLRLERNRKPEPAAPLPVQEIINHHVFHGLPDGLLPQGYSPAPVIRATSERVSVDRNPVARKAIAAAPAGAVRSQAARRPGVRARVARMVR
jgi:hypothetical protein